jgi:hypothetical protein
VPFGVNNPSVRNLPNQSYAVDDAAFTATAKKNVQPVFTGPPNNPFGGFPFALPQTGIAATLLVKFVGTLTVASGGSTPGDRWPYGLLDQFSLSVNGQQDLISVYGEDLRVRHEAAFPVFAEDVDVFPGVLGGDGDAIAEGTYAVDLTWRVCIATEEVTLTGALYAQSPSTSILTNGTPVASIGALFPLDDSTNATLNGTWSITETFFVPSLDNQGRVIIPSGLASLHTLTANDITLGQNGLNRLNLVRGSGNLQRLFMAFRSGTSGSPSTRLSTAPNAAAASKIDALQFTYGSVQVPYVWNPSSDLLSTNNQDYGETLPYDYVCLDTLKQNPQRDAIVFAGLTEMAIIATVDSAVSLSGGTAHLVQETVFS